MPVKADTRGSRDTAKQLRSVRALINSSEWLEWPLVWTGKRLEYQKNKESIFPDANRIARTQRNFHKLFEFKTLLKKEVDDVDAWKEERALLLKRAKFVNGVGEPDFKALLQAAKNKNKKQIGAIAKLLEVEALVMNSLPESPCRMLTMLAPDCRKDLEAFVQNSDNTSNGKAVAALCLGAVYKESTGSSKQTVFSKQTENSDWYARCYRWGQECGLEIDPAIVIKALQKKDGVNLLRKLSSFAREATRLTISNSTIKRALDSEAKLNGLIECYRELSEIEILLPTLLQYRHELTTDDDFKRKMQSLSLEKGRRVFARDFATLLERFVSSDASAKTLQSIRAWIEDMLTRFSCDEKFVEEILNALKAGILLEGQLREPFFRILQKYSSKIWTLDQNGHLNPIVKYCNTKILQGIQIVLADCKDPVLIDICLERDLIANIILGRITDAPKLRFVLDVIDRLDLKNTLDIGQLCLLVRSFADIAEAQTNLEPAIREIEKAPFSMRAHYFEAIDLAQSKRSTKSSLAAITRFLPHLIAVTADDDSQHCPCTNLASAAVNIAKLAPRHEQQLFARLVQIFKAQSQMTLNKLDAINPGCLLGLAFIKAGVTSSEVTNRKAKTKEDSPAQVMEDAIEIFLSHNIEHFTLLNDGLEVLRSYPILTRLIARQYRQHPKRMTRVVERLGMANKWGAEAMKPINKVLRYKQAFKFKNSDHHALKRIYAKGWGEFLRLTPDMVPQILFYILSKSITGGSQSPPDVLLRLIETPEKMERERGYLASLAEMFPDRADLARRLASLETRLKEKEEMAAFSNKLVRKHIVHLASEAEFEAIESMIREVFMKQLKRIAGSVSPEIKIDNHLINALLLTQDITENKRLLKRLIRAYVEGDLEWRERMPANAKFLERLKLNGVDPKIWLAPYSKTYHVEGVQGESVTIRMETDPLKILEMGNYFDTCLSLQGPFSYSTVVNASDLNKRVAYAYDKNGKVIARKLVGINEDNRLIGYATYSSIPSGKALVRLKEVFVEYMKGFAEHANLQLGDLGIVPSLLSPHWYDDGPIAWDFVEPQEENVEPENQVHRLKPARPASR